jgi:Flp pilus assembly protein TadG
VKKPRVCPSDGTGAGKVNMMSKLFSTTRIPAIAGKTALPHLRCFMRGEEGNVTIFSIMVISMLVTLAGVSYDLKASEMQRVKIQNVADRAVLAAADLDQLRDPETVVKDYFTKAGYPHLANKITVSEGLNFRTVSVDSSGTYTPYFMQKLLGVSDLPINTKAEAEERVNNVEISMVLDISGSMGSGSKMANLRDAASTFVDTVINPSTRDLVSLSIIPYSEHVSAGPEIMSHFNVAWNNPYSHCMEFSENDFNTARMRRDKQYEQVQHFQWGYNGQNNTINTPVCPVGAHEDIVAFSQDAVALKDKISRLVPRGSTSIFAGMKWAAGLLDPDFRTITSELIDSGDADAAFLQRPALYSDNETLKTVILMTDGQNHWSHRINSNYYANLSHAAHWNRYNLDWYLDRYVNSWQHNQFKYLKYSPEYGDTLLNSVCNAAKAQNIVIWSVGFEVTDHGANVMRNCASSPSHFFRVEGVEITEAFRAIARQINQLRLTQ